MILKDARYPREQVEELIRGVATMVLGIRGIEDSWVYQDILAEGIVQGKAKGIAEALLRLGRKTLGPPDERVTAAITAITDRERLDALVDRITEVATWDELLALF